ncbi:hypothetical protein ES677_11525 [Bizionia gelidisalsuginis]|uniref:Uncharacterized protein n=1 Tax=Bizionia gelidisalsuginis TaxID=291188 RepID=A0ABY3M8L6_9FLAO|nr:hypothetical protein [Bizionia gelidisalsuginis]TYC10564.1 hypothetical protein ES677_11525 [Bizionia gelidisalsuginis]
MEVSIYVREYDIADSVQNFMDFYYSIQMKHLASDLLEQGLTPNQITDAVSAAIKAANASGIETHKHFMPVFSALREGVIKDCKLSELGYGLVLMNADSSLAVVSNFKLDMLKKYLNIAI